MALVQVAKPDSVRAPVLPPQIQERVHRFLKERQHSHALLVEGFTPPSLIMLKGAPGTGKTMLARWMASSLDLDLVMLDLSTSISSFLGKTGNNLRRSFDYARSSACVLFLDEFDAIAKRRDDESEVGELKRIVNVLLKEMEDWPTHSVLVAATNHPELLDQAIHRRFDVVIEVPLPGLEERQVIIAQACGRFGSAIPSGLLAAMSHAYEGLSGSDIVTDVTSVVRRHLIEQIPLDECLLQQLRTSLDTTARKRRLGPIVRALRESTALSVRGIADIVGLSSTAVQHHLTKETSNG